MIGDILRNEREKQNLTIKDIERETSIRAFYIESIEKGNYDVLPGVVYTRGFIKNYATFLQLDAAKIVSQFNAEMQPDAPSVEDKAPEREKQAEPVRPKASSYQQSERQTVFRSGDDFHARVEKSRRSQRLLTGVLVLLFLAGGAYFFWPDMSATQPAPQKTVTETKQQVREQPVQQEKKFDDVEISAKFTDACWTKVEADGKTIFEGTIEKGKSYSWQSPNKIIITAGNAGAIDITHNGKSIGKLGKTGEVISKSFTRDKVEDVK